MCCDAFAPSNKTSLIVQIVMDQQNEVHEKVSEDQQRPEGTTEAPQPPDVSTPAESATREEEVVVAASEKEAAAAPAASTQARRQRSSSLTIWNKFWAIVGPDDQVPPRPSSALDQPSAHRELLEFQENEADPAKTDTDGPAATGQVEQRPTSEGSHPSPPPKAHENEDKEKVEETHKPMWIPSKTKNALFGYTFAFIPSPPSYFFFHFVDGVISHCCGLPSVPSNGQTSEPGHWRAKVDDHARQVRSTFNQPFFKAESGTHSHTAAVTRVCTCVRWQSRPSWVHSAPLLRLPPFHVRRPWVEFRRSSRTVLTT